MQVLIFAVHLIFVYKFGGGRNNNNKKIKTKKNQNSYTNTWILALRILFLSKPGNKYSETYCAFISITALIAYSHGQHSHSVMAALYIHTGEKSLDSSNKFRKRCKSL